MSNPFGKTPETKHKVILWSVVLIVITTIVLLVSFPASPSRMFYVVVIFGGLALIGYLAGYVFLDEIKDLQGKDHRYHKIFKAYWNVPVVTIIGTSVYWLVQFLGCWSVDPVWFMISVSVVVTTVLLLAYDKMIKATSKPDKWAVTLLITFFVINNFIYHYSDGGSQKQKKYLAEQEMEDDSEKKSKKNKEVTVMPPITLLGKEQWNTDRIFNKGERVTFVVKWNSIQTYFADGSTKVYKPRERAYSEVMAYRGPFSFESLARDNCRSQVIFFH